MGDGLCPPVGHVPDDQAEDEHDGKDGGQDHDDQVRGVVRNGNISENMSFNQPVSYVLK